MKIGIIGAGQIDGTLTRRLTALGHDVAVADSRGPETLGELTAELGASVKAVTVDEAVEADIILVAVGSVAFKDVGAVLQATDRDAGRMKKLPEPRVPTVCLLAGYP